MIENELMSVFEVMDLGELQGFLGVKCDRNGKRTVLPLILDEYTNKLLKQLGFSEMRPQHTPVVASKLQTEVDVIERKI